MSTLYDAKLDLAKLIMRVKTGTATSVAGPGEFSDTRRTEADDYFYRTMSNGGTIFFPDRSQSREITLYEKTGPTFSFVPADITPAVDETYIAAPVEWDFYELTQAINMALEDLGQQSGVPQVDETLEIVSRQGVYTLPAGVSNVKKVYLVLDEDNPDLYTTHHLMWDTIGDELHLDPGSEPLWGDHFKLIYCAPHAVVENDSDIISSYINPMLLKWTAAVFALENVDKTEAVLSKLNRAIKTSEAYKSRHALDIQRDPHLAYTPDEDY